MTSKEIRQSFLDFFASKGHKIVPSAPLVNKEDPTLMFINAGMNPFKDYFLGNKIAVDTRIADTQKCLRVSGKHNDLEEVGVDSYHHTLFEMLGNWSFGDYFKEESITWAWELLTEVYKLPKDRLYVTIFEGDASENLEKDNEAAQIWEKWIAKDRILLGNKKDNFWEMGDQGPCGPCSEIHVDLRSDEQRSQVDGKILVNNDHPLVVEIWNLVFIQFNRKADGNLETLPAKHVDTGMGFERLCMAIQGKNANYATDIFANSIAFLEKQTGIAYTNEYGPEAKTDTAFRVLADHVRAVAFAIADGQMPSNTGAGYVIRRILRRAIRYYYSVLNFKEPIIHELSKVLADDFKDIFPELFQQIDFVSKVIFEEEKSFLRTLEDGLKRIDNLVVKSNVLNGADAFELYDTYGFPFDLTNLIAQEKGWSVDEKGFNDALQAQKTRSRSDAGKSVSDWIEIAQGETKFIGYDHLSTNAHLIKYRLVDGKTKQIQCVLDNTVFYPEGGGQVGDKGVLHFENEIIQVLNTVKENDLIIHIIDKLPSNLQAKITAQVNNGLRQLTENNHSATHLLHAALKQVLGDHVQQKGSLVNDEYLRFDFAHFSKMSDEEIKLVENIVNNKIRESIQLEEFRDLPIEEAKQKGATMLFGEKYGEKVRMITFDANYSKELCGGCHVDNTGQIGLFKIKSEAAVAAGVRRIEGLTAVGAIQFVDEQITTLQTIKELTKHPKDVVSAIEKLQEENKKLQNQVDQLNALQVAQIKSQLVLQAKESGDAKVIVASVEISDAKAIKNLAFQLKNEVSNLLLVLTNITDGKPMITVAIDEDLAKRFNLNASAIVRDLSKHINGGGGGQAHFATAGGTDVNGIAKVLENASSLLN